MNPIPQLVSNVRAFWAGLINDANHQSRYMAWLCFIGGIVMLAPAWMWISTGKTEATVIGSGRGSGSPSRSGPDVRVTGALTGLVGIFMIVIGGRTLLLRQGE